MFSKVIECLEQNIRKHRLQKTTEYKKNEQNIQWYKIFELKYENSKITR